MTAGQLLWQPSAERAATTRIAALARRAGLDDTVALHRWSVTDPTAFWELAWTDLGVIGDRGRAPAFDPTARTVGGVARTGRFFADAAVSYAENLLGHTPDPASPAVIDVDEAGVDVITTWAELEALVASTAAALRDDGVQIGDRVAAWMPNITTTVVVALAASAIGAVFTSTSPDFGVDGVVERFGQVDPVVLVAADGYRYGGKWFDLRERITAAADRLPSLRRVVVVPRLRGSANGGDPARSDAASTVASAAPITWADWLAPHHGAEPRYTRLPFDHPGFVLYSSGTTGPPKCIVHRAAGVLLMHLKEHQYHCDVRPGDRFMYFTTCGWMMWNWQLSALASGATIVCYDGNPFHPGPTALFDVASRFDLTLLGVSAKYLDACRKTPELDPARTHRLDSLRTVCSTGSPLHAEGFSWVYEHLAADVHLASISGGTDLCGCFVGGDPTAPVHAGEIQGPALGMDVEVLDDHGEPTDPFTDGELVCRPTFPSVPLGFWGDHSGERFRAAYFERFDGWWAQGDFATWTSHDGRRGMVIHGRSDATLNAGGVRIGTAEIYRVIEGFDEIAESVAIGQRWDDDTRIVLFVRCAPGHQLDEELSSRLCSAVRSACSPRHVPARIVEVTDIPRTRSNKISELAVADVVNGRPIRNSEALANPDTLDQFRDRPELAT